MVEEHIYKLRKILEELEKIRGRHTELVSVYIPAGHNLQDIVNMLRQEYTLTENVKNKTVRNNVLGAIDKILQELRFYNKTPTNGLVLFAGNVSEVEGQVDIKVWNIEPPEPLRIKKYWCDQKFELEPLQDMVAERELYGLIVLDNREATIGLLKGKKIGVLRQIESIVPGKTAKGGQCCHYSTMVISYDGSIEPISNFKDVKYVKAADFNTFSLTDSPLLDFFETRKTECYKIVTKHPRLEIETSKDHFFIVLDKGEVIEKPAEELKVEDILLMPEKIDVKGELQHLNTNYSYSFRISKEGCEYLRNRRIEFKLSQEKLAKKINVHQVFISCLEMGKRPLLETLEKISQVLNFDFDVFKSKYLISNHKTILPSIVSEDIAQVIGYFFGDGNYDKNRISFSETNENLALFYSKKISDFFNCKSKIRFRKSKNYYEIRVCNKVIHDFFKGEFIKNKDSLTCLIPSKILKSSSKILAAFMRGFFDAEGYASIRSGKLAFGINNKLLAQQIQLALLRFGIISSLDMYDNRNNPYSKKEKYSVCISDKKSFIIFKKSIGFTLSLKNDRLDELIKARTNKNFSRRSLFKTNEIVNKLKKFYDIDFHESYIGNNNFINKKRLERVMISKISNKEALSDILQLLNCPLLPVKVSKIIKFNRETPMIDLAVKHQNFIANGIFVHNSAQRYERVREGLINDWYKIIAENVRNYLSKFILKGIILGGPGPAKNDFYDGGYLLTDLKKQIIGTKNVGYTDEQGLEELVERSQDVLAEASIAKEKALLQKFFEELRKDSGLAAYGKKSVEKALGMGAIEIILINEGVEEKEITEKAEKYGTTVEIISKDTREGEQLYQLGGIAAILRWKI